MQRNIQRGEFAETVSLSREIATLRQSIDILSYQFRQVYIYKYLYIALSIPINNSKNINLWPKKKARKLK